MQIVHFTDEKIGSLDWELPPNVAKVIDRIPYEYQREIIDELTRHVKAHLLLLCGTTFMGERAPRAFDLIEAAELALLNQLKQIAKD